MLTVGVDLAAEPRSTAVALIEWSAGRAALVDVVPGADDERVVSLSSGADKIGIDCALGWPNGFVDFLSRHRTNDHALTPAFGTQDWRRELTYRETDRRVRDLIGRWPLSVATDRLGSTALRCAGLVERLALAGVDTDRSGRGGIVEVYPAGSLRRWGLSTPGYRTSEDLRGDLLDRVSVAAPWLDLSAFRELLVESCDAFDAVIASLSSRAAATHRATLPRDSDLHCARTEGWIALPDADLSELVNAP